MIDIQPKTLAEIRKIERAGSIVGNCHYELRKRIVSGMRTIEIDAFIEAYLLQQGAVPAQKGYKGYPYASCISVNEVACHGFPNHYELKKGDLVTVDFVADVQGWKADSAWTYMIGEGSHEARRLLKAAKAALRAGIEAATIGSELSDIGYAIERCAELSGYKVIAVFSGHGIGQGIHEPPQVLHTRAASTGIKLQEGMVITIEPILTAGSTEVYIAHDGWTARTIDHSLSAQFEHTIVITKQGAKILTTPMPSKNSNMKTTKSKSSKSI